MSEQSSRAEAQAGFILPHSTTQAAREDADTAVAKWFGHFKVEPASIYHVELPLSQALSAPSETHNDNGDLFDLWWTLPVSDAKTLLQRFEQEGVRFEIAPDQSQISRMHPHIASVGGSFGIGAQIKIFIHRDDAEPAERIRKKFCGC